MKLLVINYHYFREEKTGRSIFPVSPEDLKQQQNKIREDFKTIDQEGLLSFQPGKMEEAPYSLVTFDDGLSEQMDAFHILKDMGIPALFFVPSYPYLEGKALDVHKLHYVRYKLPDTELLNYLSKRQGMESYNFDQDILDKEYRYDDPSSQKIKFFFNFVLNPMEKSAAIHDLFTSLIEDEKRFCENFYMSLDDLKILHDANMLATHCHSHRPLAELSQLDYQEDIDLSLEFFKKQDLNNIQSISYPYGGPKSVSNEIGEFAKTRGLRLGFTMIRGLNRISKDTNFLMLNRVDTNDAPGGSHFKETLLQ